jgi:hypothetical protein
MFESFKCMAVFFRCRRCAGIGHLAGLKFVLLLVWVTDRLDDLPTQALRCIDDTQPDCDKLQNILD